MRFIQGLFIGYGLVIDKTLASKQSSFRVRPAPLMGLQNTTSEPADDVTVAIHRLMVSPIFLIQSMLVMYLIR